MKTFIAALILLASVCGLDASLVSRYEAGVDAGKISDEMESAAVDKTAGAWKGPLLDSRRRFLDENHTEDGNVTALEEDDHEEEDGNHTDHEDGEHEEDDGHDDHEDDGHDDGHDDHDDHDSESALDANSSALEDKPWGAALLAAFLVNLCTLTGIVVLLPASYLGRNASKQTRDYVFHIIIPSFACGALLATAVFLLIPEAILLLSGGHADHSDEGGDEEGHEGHGHRMLEGEEESAEADAAWKFEEIPDEILENDTLENETLSEHTTELNPKPLSKDVESHDVEEMEVDADDPNGVIAEKSNMVEQSLEVGRQVRENSYTSGVAVVKKDAPPDYQLAGSILAGDFFHNFADGIFIGAAFLLCSRDIAIVVTASTVFHELCQELADFFLLTNQCRFPVWKALLLNFMSGFSVLLGVVVIFATDVSNATIGIVLAMSAGVYFYVALTETAPRVNAFIVDVRMRATSFLFWVLGAIPIGLVLLNHSHCD